MAKPVNEIAKTLNKCTDLGKARVVMGIAEVCGTAFQLNELMGEVHCGPNTVVFTSNEERQAHELLKALVFGFGKVSADCTNTTINMAAEALNHEDAPIGRAAVEFLRGEFLRIAQVAEGLARGLGGEKMPVG